MVEHSGSTGGYRTDIARFPAAAHERRDDMQREHRQHDHAVACGRRHRARVAVHEARGGATCRGVRASQQGAQSVTLSDAELNAYVGRFYSEELDATYEVARSGSALLLRRPRTPTDTLRATDHRTLRASGLILNFTPGQPSSPMFTVDAGRARGIEFIRVAPSGK